MADLSLTLVRATFKVLPTPLRERLAVRVFMARRDHGEPARETLWRDQGDETTICGNAAVAFGPADGPIAFLMHGWEGRGLQLAGFIEPLVAAGHRVIALDGPGHGKNGKGLGALPTFSAFLEEAIRKHRPAIVVGHSLGSAAAIVAASRTGFNGRILGLGGPMETLKIFARARRFMGLPASGQARFVELLMRVFDAYRTDDLSDIEACARAWGGPLHAVLAARDDEVPPEESAQIVAAAGGAVTILHTANHRSVMWTPEAIEAGKRFLLAPVAAR